MTEVRKEATGGRGRRRYTDKYLAALLLEVYREQGNRRISAGRWDVLRKQRAGGRPMPSAATYVLRFGSWDRAWSLAGVDRVEAELDKLRGFKRALDEYVVSRKGSILAGESEMEDAHPWDGDALREMCRCRLDSEVWDYTYGRKRNARRVDVAPSLLLVESEGTRLELESFLGRPVPAVRCSWLLRNAVPEERAAWGDVLRAAGFTVAARQAEREDDVERRAGHSRRRFPDTGGLEGEVAALVVGLGNPGHRYRHARHNVGLMAAGRLAARFAPVAGESWHNGWLSIVEENGRYLALLAPGTFMNTSGRTVLPVFEHYRLETERVIVLHDDIGLPPGEVKTKRGGSTGRHRGLDSIRDSLRDDSFLRVRIGIGRPSHGDVADYVLGDFTPRERDSLEDSLDLAADAALRLAGEGPR